MQEFASDWKMCPICNEEYCIEGEDWCFSCRDEHEDTKDDYE